MNYRFTLEKYRGLSTRYTCPQCGRKHTFTRYIDTENNNQYINDNVGKCNRLDKCGYHYTPREYFTDNPHKRDRGVPSFSFHREKEEKKIENLPPKPIGRLPRWFMEQTLGIHRCITCLRVVIVRISKDVNKGRLPQNCME